jgi:uncharacterized OB-fold protein
MKIPEWAQPAPDRDSRPWWEALARHELLLQRCDGCGCSRWPARAVCNRCGSLDWRWCGASGEAVVASWIVTHHAFSPAWPTPYVVVLARLDEQDDLLVPGAFAGAVDAPELAVGRPLVAEYEDVRVADGGAFTLLRWRGR